MRMEGHNEISSSLGVKSILNKRRAAQDLVPSKEFVKDLIREQPETYATTIPKIAEQEQSNTCATRVRQNPIETSALARFAVDECLVPHGARYSLEAIGEREPREETSGNFRRELKLSMLRDQADETKVVCTGEMAGGKGPLMHTTNLGLEGTRGLSIQSPMSSDQMQVPEHAQRLLDVYTRPFKRSFAPVEDQFSKIQTLDRRNPSNFWLGNSKRNNVTSVNGTNNVRPENANLEAEFQNSPSIHQQAKSCRFSNTNLSAISSGEYFNSLFITPDRTSNKSQSTSHSTGEGPEPLLGDSHQIPPSASNMVRYSPFSVNQSSVKVAVNRDSSSNSRIQTNVPSTIPPKGDGFFQAQSPHSRVASKTNERQKRLAPFEEKNSPLTSPHRSTAPLTPNLKNDFLMLQQTQHWGANRALHQAACPRDQLAIPHTTTTLGQYSPSANRVLDQVTRLDIHEVPRVSLVNNTTDYHSIYDPLDISSRPWDASYPSSAKMQKQQEQHIRPFLQDAPNPVRLLPQTYRATSANNDLQPYGQPPVSQKRKHIEMIDLTQDDPRPHKKLQTATFRTGNLNRLDKLWDNNVQQMCNVKDLQQKSTLYTKVGVVMAPMVPRSGAPMHHQPQRPPILPQIAHQFDPLPPTNSHSQAKVNSYLEKGTRSISGVILPDRFQFSDHIIKPLLYRSAKNGPYDPQSIAKSILLATNSHPTEKGLNFHLRRLRRYEAVNDSSDLSTFRWDLVDPKPVAGSQQATNGQQFLAMPPTGPNNGYQQLPIHSSQLRHGTFPANVNAIPSRPNEQRQVSSNGSSTVISSAIPSRDGMDSRLSKLGDGHVPLPNTTGPIQPPKQSSTASTSRDGWPSDPGVSYYSSPRPKTTSTSKIAVEIRSPAFQSVATSTAPKKRGRPIKSTEASLSVQPVPKKRGRPFRDPEAAAAATAKKARVAAGGLPKKRGRPFKIPHDMDDIPLRDPKFLVFKCEWSGCSAELHNIEVLRLHLVTAHGKKIHSSALSCLWSRCGRSSIEKSKKIHDDSMKTREESTNHPNPRREKVTVRLPKDYYETVKDVCRPLDKHPIFTKESKPANTVAKTLQRFEFKNQQEWEAHLEEAHLFPYAWHMGDGPKGTLNITHIQIEKKKQTPWLYDKDGNQVIDSVEGQEIEDGKPAKNNDKRFNRVRRGIHIVLEPVKNPEAYKVYEYDDK